MFQKKWKWGSNIPGVSDLVITRIILYFITEREILFFICFVFLLKQFTGENN